MIDIPTLLKIIEGADANPYAGPVDVVVDKRRKLAVIGQGDRAIVITIDQALTLVEVLMFKLGSGS